MPGSDRVRTVILGAGASRAVSYATQKASLSPLDGDFFELLQRLEPKNPADDKAKEFVIEQALASSGDQLWNSLERLFYTRHLNAVLRDKLLSARAILGSGSSSTEQADKLLKNFARAIQALLRAAHGKEVCFHHQRLFQRLTSGDAIISFNYDLVPERALREYRRSEDMPEFGPWLYGFGRYPKGSMAIPRLHKLHGSVNWQSTAEGSGPELKPKVKQKSWKDFDKQPGYADYAPPFSILLPYWEKRVERPPWLEIWQRAAGHLLKTTSLIIWGYSLPLTDLKARELLRITLGGGDELREVCVIDPSKRVRDKWRSEFVRQKFWHYSDIEEFLAGAPPWCRYPPD